MHDGTKLTFNISEECKEKNNGEKGIFGNYLQISIDCEFIIFR